MYQRVKAYVEKYHMLERGDKVIVGVSGGADSVCLLFMLLELQKEKEITIIAVHVHHGIRGRAADADEDYVRKICREQNVELYVWHEDVKYYAMEHKMTLEEAGRNVRRKVFEDVMAKCGGTRIALAHHQNDNAETLLWNLCRGCGLRGMGGIAPVDGVYIRPLLCLRREETEVYLKNQGISYCIDETNLEDTYTRNRLRGHVIPYLEEEIDPQAVQHMSETMEQMRKLSEFIEMETARYAEMCIDDTWKNGRRVLVRKEAFFKVPEVLRSYIVHELLCRVAGRRKDIEQIHVKLTEELFGHQVGRKLSLPYEMTAERCYEGIELYRKGGWLENPSNEPELERKVIEEEEPHVVMRVFEKEHDMEAFPQKTYTKWFDYDIIKNTVKIRHREPGDSIVINHLGETQKLKQYFINNKIPREERDRIWLVADGDQIMWIVGYRQSQKYQITDKTRKILEIEICGGKKNGRASKSIGS